jgi:hypothetical protein
MVLKILIYRIVSLSILFKESYTQISMPGSLTAIQHFELFQKKNMNNSLFYLELYFRILFVFL